MQKCFYHAKTDAATQCMGCKMPVCAPCREAGAKGFCESCMRKVGSLGDQITDMKKTGVVGGSHKATMVKSAGRPTAQKNVTYCFHHFDQVAQGVCPSCNRSYCTECLDAGGMCTHCAKQAKQTAAPAARVAGRRANTGSLPGVDRPPGGSRPAPKAAPVVEASGGPSKPIMFFTFAVIVFVAIAAYKLFVAY